MNNRNFACSEGFRGALAKLGKYEFHYLQAVVWKEPCICLKLQIPSLLDCVRAKCLPKFCRHPDISWLYATINVWIRITTNHDFSQNGLLSKIGAHSKDDSVLANKSRQVRSSKFRTRTKQGRIQKRLRFCLLLCPLYPVVATCTERACFPSSSFSVTSRGQYEHTSFHTFARNLAHNFIHSERTVHLTRQL